MARSLPYHEGASVLHGEGLAAELKGEAAQAESKFLEATRLVEAEMPAGVAREVQLAHIEEDVVYNRFRFVLGAAKPEDKAVLIDNLRKDMEKVIGRTVAFVGVARPAFEGDWQQLTSRRQHEEARQRHAAAGGLAGRIMLSHLCANGEIAVGQKAAAATSSKLYYFGSAYRLARVGPTQYDATSIAMHGARAERAMGYPLRMAPWLGRAVVSSLRAVRYPRQLKASVLTMGRVGLELRSQKTAIAATQHPRKA